MGTSLKNKKQGEQNGVLLFSMKFFDFPGGVLVDDDGFSPILPAIRIYKSDNTVHSNPTPTRTNKGLYDYNHSIALTDEISDQWKIRWSITINGKLNHFDENFEIVEAGTLGTDAFADFGEAEHRIGAAFGTRDTTSTHHAKIPQYPDGKVSSFSGFKGWGKLITPDELRGIVLFGTKLVSPDASQTYDDNMLQYYIDDTIAWIERDLNYDILPRIVRHDDPINQAADINNAGSLDGVGSPIRVVSDIVKRVDLPPEEQEPHRVRELGYPFRINPARHYVYIQLRRRPLIDMLKAVLIDPVQNTVIDIYNYRTERKGSSGAVQFFANVSSPTAFPFLYNTLTALKYPFPGLIAFYMDYRTGYINVADVPFDLRQLALMIAGVRLLEDFGDGKIPGLASASVNLNSISESFATTQSATNSLYGARIAYYKDRIKKWYKNNAQKYSRTILGIL